MMDKTRLIVKNLSNEISNLTKFFRENYGAIAVKSFGRRRSIVIFPNENVATTALYKLHQREFFGKIISAEYFGYCRQNKKNINDLEEDCDSKKNFNEIKIPELIKSLYATSKKFDFDQPPPPYLRYCYPKINRNILDSISIALLTNTKFYTQVLHLMNRMNLEPPFLLRDKPFIPPGELCDAQIQTDFHDESKNLLASDESELESDLEDKFNKFPYSSVKRKKFDNNDEIKKKARKILSSQINVKQQVSKKKHSSDIRKIFELKRKSNIGSKISMNVTSVKIPSYEADISENCTNQEISETDQKKTNVISKIKENPISLVTCLISAEDLKTNRIPENQLNDLPIYKNYEKGSKSNKLYIKNLNKNVTENDLRSIYERFSTTGKIDIKLMQHGRMKGQAFITFETINDDFDGIEKALIETNGYILKNKPMVVSYGKKTN